jgi:HPt (histidine-containing phosphotransfer) domain-containing protein
MGHVSDGRDMGAFLEGLWLQVAHVAKGRVDVLEAYVAAARGGAVDDELRAAAESAAHKLAGALGSYQRAGSEEAAQAENLLRGGAAGADEMAPLVAVLRASVGAS